MLLGIVGSSLASTKYSTPGRRCASNRGFLSAEKNKGKTKCNFCLKLGHNATSTCSELATRQMNQKLTHESFSLIANVPELEQKGVNFQDVVRGLCSWAVGNGLVVMKTLTVVIDSNFVS